MWHLSGEGLAAQPWGQCAANITCAMSLLCSQKCIREDLRTLRSQPLSSLLKSGVLSLQITLPQYKDFYCGRIREALSLPVLLHSYQNKT